MTMHTHFRIPPPPAVKRVRWTSRGMTVTSIGACFYTSFVSGLRLYTGTEYR